MERAVTIDDVLAVIDKMSQETRALFRETEVQQKETFAELRALQQETAAQLRKTAVQIEETNKKMGDLSNRFGEVVEYIVSPHLERKFKSLGITLNTVAMEQVIYDDEGKRIAEIDIFMSNGEYAVAVEVKAKPNQKDVKNHVKRMEKIREHADKHNDKKKYIGAIAGMIISDKVKNCAFEHGFPVLVPSGDGVELVYPEGFSPTEW
ncbi:MAG: hypothetical protein LBB43_04095 [Spirochaetaceae bacterium]|jgi:hypothetical protein|nr:hypothetical protein [Spirochaetaceae bacterium]